MIDQYTPKHYIPNSNFKFNFNNSLIFKYNIIKTYHYNKIENKYIQIIIKEKKIILQNRIIIIDI